MANDFIVHGVASLHAVDHFAFLVISHTRNHSHSLMVVGIEVLVFGVDFLHTKTLQCLNELVEDHLHSFFNDFRVFTLVGNGTLKVIENGQNSGHSLHTTVENEIGFLAQRALLIIIELCSRAKIAVFELLYFCLCLSQRIFLLLLSLLLFTAYIAQGEVLPVRTRSFGAIGIFAIPEMGRFYRHVLIEGNFPHHGAVAFGHFGKTLFDVFKYIGVEDVSFNQPKGMLYKSENPFA